MKYLTLIIYSLTLLLVISCEKPEKATETTKPSTNVSYVGDSRCAECHSEENNLWKGSHHAKSMMHANDSTISADFNDITFKHNGVTSNFFKENGAFYVYTEGIGGQYDTFQIEYTFGVTPLQQYLVKTNNGKLQALRTAWDVENNKWYDLYNQDNLLPQDWLHWTRGGMNWNTMCAECHSTDLKKNYNPKNDSYQTYYSSINVSCESCHGPGEAHITSVETGKDSEYASMLLNEDTYFANQVRACAPCHSRKSNLTDQLTFTGEFMNDYVLSVLTDGLYHADGQINDEVYVYGSFLQSKMYANGVKCTDCHDAHSLELKQEGNNLCLQCHESSYDDISHTHHEKGTEGSQCIECHMTGKIYMGTDFRRDHSFRVPRPDQSVKFGTPNACTECHDSNSPQWASEKVEEWFGKERKFHFSDVLAKGRERNIESLPDLVGLLYDTAQPAIARATSAYYLGEIPAMESVEALTQGMTDRSALVRYYSVSGFMNFPEKEKGRVLPLLKDSVRSVRTMAANILLSYQAEQLPEDFQKPFILAVSELEKTIYKQLDFPMGHFQMAQYLYRKGDMNGALEYFKSSLEMDTMLHISRENMARIYNSMGENDKAVQALKTTLSFDEENAQAHYSIGLVYAELKDYQKAVEHLERSVELDPANERAKRNLELAKDLNSQ